MEKLILISAQPANQYFLWQINVQAENFRQLGVSDKMHVLLWYREGDNLTDWHELNNKYPEVKFFFYQDEGADIGVYLPVLRPHTLKKHFQKYSSYFHDKCFFYHDSDIIFNRLPDFEELMKGDICWESDTTGYLDYTYITNKEKQGNIPHNEALKKLAEIGEITPETIQSYDKKTGGAQYLLKGINHEMWEDVEKMALQIIKSFHFTYPDSINRKYFKSENEGFQSWTADMWAVNFALWKRGIKTDITKELDFSWATDNIDTFKKKSIFHLAGVVNSKNGLFFKGEWISKSPIGKNLPLPAENSACRPYVELINSIQ